MSQHTSTTTAAGGPNRAPQPSVRIRRERRYRPTEGGTFHLLLHVTAPTATHSAATPRSPLDLAFVLDRSGSMSDGSWELARDGALHAMRLLNGTDSVSVTVFDTAIDLLLAQRWYSDDAQAKATRRLGRVGPRGGTALADGWASGCAQLAPLADGQPLSLRPHHQPTQTRPASSVPQRRTLLLTDGYANQGITDPQQLAQHAAGMAARGVSTSTFGVGPGYDEVLLAGMADAGRGRFHHIPHALSIPEVFATELDEMLQTVMLGLTVGLELPSTYTARLLNDLPDGLNRGETWVRLGDVINGEVRTLIWELTLPRAAEGAQEQVGITLRWRDPHSGVDQALHVDHTLGARQRTGEIDPELAAALTPVLIGRRREELLQLNRAGAYDDAQALLIATRATVRQYASEATIEHFFDGAQAAAAPMRPEEMKRQFAGSRQLREGRSVPPRRAGSR